MTKPILGITMGDPAGIGSEITVKALTHPEVYDSCCPVVFGDAQQLERMCNILKLDVKINTISDIDELKPSKDTINVIDFEQCSGRCSFVKLTAFAASR